jgi:glycosyltransferase involved in cell wall biosynthesis
VRAPLLSVILITYHRVEALRRTLASFRRHADLDDYEVIICDDGSPPEQRRQLARLGADRVMWNDRVGYGANVNSGMRVARGEFVFHLEDDWVVARSGHFLRAGMEVLTELPELGCVKYNDNTPALRARRDVNGYRVDVLAFPNTTANRQGEYRYTNRPHLKHARFHAAYGLYPEGFCALDTECRFALRVNQTRGPRIGWIHDSVHFRHIGDDYQSFTILGPGQNPEALRGL